MSEPFDFDAFIRGTSLARRKVSAYRVDHRDEIARLTAEHDALPADGGDDREAHTTTPRKALADRIAALRAEMEASRVDWTLRTLTPDEFAALPDEEDEAQAPGGTPAVFRQMSTMSRAPEGCPNPSLYNDLPNWTPEQWRQVSQVLGVAQWGELVKQANALVLSKVAVPDFSQSVSQTLSPQASSES